MGVHRNTKKEILGVAEELLQTRGFQGFSYHHIAAVLGVRNAAIHYHFPTKNDLGVALIQRFRESFRWWAGQLREQGADPATCLERFIAIERRYLQDQRVCPLGVVSVEYAGVPDEMRRAARELMEDVTIWLDGVLDHGRRSGAFRFKGGTRSRALAILAALQGALQLARMQGEDVFGHVAIQIRADLGMPLSDVSQVAAAG